MPTIYYAGPLFTDAERAWNAANAKAMARLLPEINWAIPQEFCQAHDTVPDQEGRVATPDFAAIFASCRSHIDTSSAMLAVLDGADADSGTCWEMGYAHAKNIPIVGLRTDWRPAEDGGGNAMLTRSCTAVVATIEEACEALRAALKLPA